MCIRFWLGQKKLKKFFFWVSVKNESNYRISFSYLFLGEYHDNKT